MSGFIGVVLVGLPFVGLAIGRSIKQRRGRNDATSAQSGGPSGPTQFLVIVVAIVASEIIRVVFPTWIAVIVLFGLAVICFGLVIRRQRRLRSGGGAS